MDLSTPKKVRQHLHDVANEIASERMMNASHPLGNDREFRDRRLEVVVMLLYPRLLAAEQKIAELENEQASTRSLAEAAAGAPGFITEPPLGAEPTPTVVPAGSSPHAMAEAIRQAKLAEMGPRNLVNELLIRAGRL